MPTYEYVCEECGNRFDVRQRFSDDPITTCPRCTGSVRRVLHASGVIFKGSGWYATDSRAKPASSAPTESSTTATKTDKSEPTTSTSTSDTPAATPAAETKKATPAAPK